MDASANIPVDMFTFLEGRDVPSHLIDKIRDDKVWNEE
jgi:hypothetical protein